ncbi:MAG: acyltransferase [Syntrophobacter sp.]
MLNFLSSQMLGAFSILVVGANTLFCSLLLYPLALFRLVPNEHWRVVCDRIANAIAQGWVGLNSLGLRLTKNIRWDVQGADSLRPDAWYLLVANHQSMVDIVVLQSVFHRKAPPLKFFLKKELFWVPVIGLAWWVLDFPFMKRSASPRQDIETTRNACEKFKKSPVTIMNFVEGTRFTAAKKEKQKSPFTHLLEPKPGGMAIALCSLGQQLRSVLDVTIAYPKGIPGLWGFLCSRTLEINVRIKQIPVTPELLGDYLTDRAYRRKFRDWLYKLWGEKDDLMQQLVPPAPHNE